MPKMGKDSFSKVGKSTTQKPYQKVVIMPKEIRLKELLSLADHGFVPPVPLLPLRDVPIKRLYHILQYQELSEDMNVKYPSKGGGVAYRVLLTDYRSKLTPRPRISVIAPERYGNAIRIAQFLVYEGMAKSAGGHDYHKITTFVVPDYLDSEEEEEEEKVIDKLNEKKCDGMCVVEANDEPAFGFCSSCGEKLNEAQHLDCDTGTNYCWHCGLELMSNA